ncbi:OLC1v1002647C1 [Oldenlandia corymbosa var. corymbosa]|uniref:OLC1v1002647C1 n=1 Tax=Oldenlandia corymbosa var. corymbosa TaxID=529605 RepID=A0AAV1DAI2_OLDCO|nr:OLC1v1002647C1 [Oldenlandia corymbosa var. corymbosa]
MSTIGSERMVKVTGDQIQEEERQSHERSSWSDAPVDILRSILCRLFVGDAATFSAVCKSWRLVTIVRSTIPPPVPNPNDELTTCPYLLLSNKFFHPLYNASFQKMDIQKLPKGIVHVANYGWLLIARGRSIMFFYHPFTNRRIDLPDIGPLNSFKLITFSSPPNSPDCEIVRIRRDVSDKIVVETMKRGKAEFSTSLVFRDAGSFELSRCNPVFYRGKYYFIGSEGNLVIYDPKRSKPRRTGSPKHMWGHVSYNDCQYYMFEGEGDLWAVFVAGRGKELCVCKLNMEKMIWEMVHNLKGRMIFVSRTSSFIERTNVRGADNKIYFPKFRENNVLFYSLATKKFHTFERGSSYDSYHNSKQMLLSVWIKIDPHHVEISEEGISW